MKKVNLIIIAILGCLIVMNVQSFSDSIMLKPGSQYIIKSISSNTNTIDDTNKNPISLTNITIILLIIAIIIYSLFKSVNKRK